MTLTFFQVKPPPTVKVVPPMIGLGANTVILNHKFVRTCGVELKTVGIASDEKGGLWVVINPAQDAKEVAISPKGECRLYSSLLADGLKEWLMKMGHLPKPNQDSFGTLPSVKAQIGTEATHINGSMAYEVITKSAVWVKRKVKK